MINATKAVSDFKSFLTNNANEFRNENGFFDKELILKRKYKSGENKVLTKRIEKVLDYLTKSGDAQPQLTEARFFKLV